MSSDTDFPIQNLPYGRFRRGGSGEPWRIGVAIGDQVLDLQARTRAVPLGIRGRALAGAARRRRPDPLDVGRRRGPAGPARGAVAGTLRRQCAGPVPRTVPVAAGRDRDGPAVPHRRLHRLLHRHPPRHGRGQAVPARPAAAAELQVGAHRLPRARSSIRVGGCDFVRPKGQFRVTADGPPVFGPSRRLDYELEIGAFVGEGNALGRPVGIDEAESRLFGCACSTTGRRATSSPGNTSRSGPSCRRTSAPRSRHGS